MHISLECIVWKLEPNPGRRNGSLRPIKEESKSGIDHGGREGHKSTVILKNNFVSGVEAVKMPNVQSHLSPDELKKCLGLTCLCIIPYLSASESISPFSPPAARRKTRAIPIMDRGEQTAQDLHSQGLNVIFAAILAF